jgi:hypothetical protein
MQNCTSLDGKTQIKNIFNSTPDRYAGELDTQTGKALAYALDWDNALAGKTTLLKTIIYSPTTKTYALGNYQTGSMNFRTPDTAMQSSIDLEGISGMAYNSKASDNKVYDLKSLFDAIKQGNACITNNPGNTQIWWNEKTLEKTKGKQASISDTEKSPNCG